MKSRRTLCNSDKQGEKRRFAGSTIAIIKGMDVRTVTSVLLKLSRRRRFQVWEITLDMALDIEQTTRVCFPAARRVIDRFHVLKLAYKAIREMRIKIRWKPWMRNLCKWHTPGHTERHIMLRSLRIVIQESSCWPEASIYFTKKNPYGPNHSVCVPVFSSGNILK